MFEVEFFDFVVFLDGLLDEVGVEEGQRGICFAIGNSFTGFSVQSDLLLKFIFVVFEVEGGFKEIVLPKALDGHVELSKVLKILLKSDETHGGVPVSHFIGLRLLSFLIFVYCGVNEDGFKSIFVGFFFYFCVELVFEDGFYFVEVCLVG